MTSARVPLLLSLAALGGCVFHVDREYRPLGTVEASVPSEGVRAVRVRNNVGDVVVRVSDGDAATVRSTVYWKVRGEETLRAADVSRDLVLVREEGVLRIENAHLDDPDDDDWKMDLTVTIPSGVDLHLTHGVGDCEVAGVSGNVEVDLGVGDLVVRTERLSGGSVKTGVGDVQLRVAEDGPDDVLDCQTGVGNLAIVLPASFEGEVDLATGVGTVSVSGVSDFSVERSVVGGSARGRIGAGDARVRGRTGTGDLSLTRGERRVY
jgi:hypothetical protein